MLPDRGDSVWEHPDRRLVFEVGGPGKQSKQIGSGPGKFLVVDELRTARPNRIPLWMAGLLY